jgi:hypothetical protein
VLFYFFRSLSPCGPQWRSVPSIPAPQHGRPTARGIEARRATAERKLRILERLTMGASVAKIARVEKITIRRARHIVAEMLARVAFRSNQASTVLASSDRPFKAISLNETGEARVAIVV